MAATSRPARRSFARRAGESAFGVLLLARYLLLGLLALLIVAGGAWRSWDTARDAMSPGDLPQGRLTLAACSADACTGVFEPSGATVTLVQPIAREPGETVDVAVYEDTGEAIRTGLPGVLYSWLPLMGALLLASVVISGGLRMYRVAAATGGLALAALGVTFALWI
ncbi:hypothetical protein E1265_29795 [Streptomyces sp. 8K308]|uniref:hypothetical protein n=1 Tax=Streptomyces sp. 8K308 TaxID=2530388 RepID=UPI001048AF36|nr:hypothetical protein [Streptomyces sp. 8K308]TDC12502.1 hypothetical protein E1265_29795 [Streptomyces sp. 8K308]